MRKFSEKCRKGLRNFFLIIGVSAVSLIFQACYGPPMDSYEWDEENKGTESSKDESKEKAAND